MIGTLLPMPIRQAGNDESIQGHVQTAIPTNFPCRKLECLSKSTHKQRNTKFNHKKAGYLGFIFGHKLFS